MPHRPLSSCLSAIYLACTLALAGCNEPTFPLAEYLVPPGEPVLEHPQVALGDGWWRWYFSYTPGADALDSSDVSCHAQGTPKGPFIDPTLPVDFLAGSGGQGAVRRTCSLEVGRHLFFPILTTMKYTDTPTKDVCRDLQEEEASLNQVVPFMEVRVNGVAVPDMALRRVHSEGCTPLSPEHGMVLDGYWLALKPLPVGEHTIEFKAHYDNDEHPLGHLSQDVKYHITIR